MRLWQANLGRGATVSEFLDNFELLLDTAGPKAVIALQEVDEADRPEEADIIRRLVAQTHRIIGGQTAVPILVPLAIPLVSRRITHACDGLAKFTPHRVVNEVTLRLGPNLTPGVLNTHLPIRRPETATRRAEVRIALKRRARSHPTGVWVADTNTPTDWPTIVRGEQSVTAAGIDRAKAWSSRGEVEISERQTLRLTIDGHDAHGARIRF